MKFLNIKIITFIFLLGIAFSFPPQTRALSVEWNTYPLPSVPGVSENTPRKLIYGNDTFVAFYSMGVSGQELLLSEDGITWLLSTAPEVNNFQDIVFANGIFIAVGDEVMYTSLDAQEWEEIIDEDISDRYWSSIVYENNTFFAYGNNCKVVGTNLQCPFEKENFILSSSDGEDWDFFELLGASPSRIVTGNGVLFGITQGGSIYSEDGKNWGYSNFPFGEIIEKFSFSEDFFFVLSRGGKGGIPPKVFLSSDGYEWTEQENHPFSGYVTFVEDTYLVSSGSSIYESQNGIDSWNLLREDNNYDYTNLLYADNKIIVFGNSEEGNIVMVGTLSTPSEEPTEQPSTPKPQQSIIGIRYCTDSITSFCKPRTTPPPTVENPFGGTTCSAELLITNNMKQGDRNGHYSSYNQGTITQVHILQSHINRLLGTDYSQAAGPVDGIFGPLSTQGVKRLQTKLNQLLPNMTPLVIDGIVGPFTKTAVNQSC